MEVALEPDAKKMYDKCKYRVKLWEHQFKKQHGRIPSKHDIREAESEVRFAYRTYFNLKASALEQSFRDIDGFESDEENDQPVTSEPTTEEILNCEELAEDIELSKANANAWGTELSNKTVDAIEEKQEQGNISSLFSKKLFDGSKFSKRNPRKSLSFHPRRSDVNANASKSQPLDNITNLEGNDENKMETDDLGMTPIETEKNSQDYINEFSFLNSSNVKIVSAQSTITSKSLNLIQSVMANDYTPRRALDAGWIARVAENTGTDTAETNVENFAISHEYMKLVSQQNKKPDYDSDELIENSDEDEMSQSVIHVAKKTRFENVIRRNSLLSNSRSNLGNNKVKDISDNKISNQANSFVSNQIINKDSIVTENLNTNSFKDILANNNGLNIQQSSTHNPSQETELFNNLILKNLEPETTKNSPRRRTTKKSQAKAPKARKPRGKKVDQQVLEPRKSQRQKQNVNFTEVEDSEIPFAGDDDKDPEYSPSNTTKKNDVYNFEDEEEEVVAEEVKVKNKKPPARQRRGKKPEPEEPAKEPEVQTYELEYSVKPRITTTPRIANVKAVIKKQAKATIEKKQKKNMSEKERLEDKVASGNLNENFVRVNLKKKIYVRGKKNFTFSKYKKNQWKQKHQQGALCGPEMDMRGCDGGLQKCFVCGEVGHFARNCQKKKGDALLPLNAVDEEEPCTIPTLEEAEKMAQESILAVRKAKKVRGGEETNRGEEGEGIGESGDEDGGSSDGEEMDSEDDALLAETLKLEEYVQKIDMKEYMDSTTAVKPYYQLNEDDSIIETPQEVFDTLAMFGYSSFRPGQEKAVMRILSGRSTLVTLSTGSGKSLCYQLPAYLYSKREPCISLIISPLVSLMEDQVVGLPGFLKAACLHTNQTKPQREKVKELISSGGLSILLVSPEAVVSGERSSGFGSFLRQLPPIAFACIDETHCVSQWSHNFRPSYLMICRILRERLGVNVILGLTATATRATCDNIVEHLQILDGIRGIISDIPLPNNLRLTVSKDPNKDHALLGLLLSEDFSKYKSIIVYCTRREECERVATFLRTSLKEEKPAQASNKKRKRMNYQAEPYHAGLAASRRRTIQKSFMSGELRIVVATVAFGMGINKSDLRAVIHFNMPNSFEGYVQEVGRAGRDGLPAHCHLFLDTNGNDENELRRHIYANSMDRHVIRKLLQKIFIPCSCKATCSKHEVAFSIQETVTALDIPEENIATLLCYLELHENRYVEVLSPAYTSCKIISYDGPISIKKAAKECPPLAMALALHGDQLKDNVFEFPVVDVAAAMGWDSGICKHKLKNLEWTSVNNQPKRSRLSVQFQYLGFRVLAPGNLSDSQLDDALDTLYTRVCSQEKQGLLQLHAVHSALSEVSERTFKLCINEVSEKELQLKTTIREYFESPSPLSKIEITSKPVVEDQIIADTRQLVAMYRDNNFTGRAVARIFYGISSPNYPAFIWGRCKFWRSHLKENFDEICKMATKEIIKMRTM